MNKTQKKPVVLQVLPELETGGVERGTVEVALEMQKQGWTNFVASKGGAMTRELERAGIKHFTFDLKSKNPFVIAKNAKKLEKIIKENNIDIVHARSRAPAWSAKKACDKTNAIYSTTFHGTYGLGFFGIKKLYNKIMLKGKKTIAISNFISEHIQKNYHIEKEKIKVIHRCVDLDKFSPKKVSPQRIINLAKKWRIPEDRPIIMLPGRLTRWKGQTVLIKALAKLENKNFRCLLVGSNQGREYYTKELQKLIKKHKLEEVVHITDNCDDMPACYMLSDIVVSASTDPEAFGRVSIEGQSMGRIVIASNHGGSRETIIDGITGRLVSAGDENLLAKELDWALALDNEQREKIANNAIENVRENFSKTKMCQKVMDYFAEIYKSENEK